MKSLVCEVICTVGEGLARVVDIVTESRQGVRGTQDRRHAQDRERGGGRHPRSLAHCICLSLKDLKAPRRKREPTGTLFYFSRDAGPAEVVVGSYWSTPFDFR